MESQHSTCSFDNSSFVDEPPDTLFRRVSLHHRRNWQQGTPISPAVILKELFPNLAKYPALAAELIFNDYLESRRRKETRWDKYLVEYAEYTQELEQLHRKRKEWGFGDTIGHFQLKGVLGQGGMGIVFHAEDTKLKRDVAIKMILQPMQADADKVKRFQFEASTVAQLENHPNLVPIYEVGTQDRVDYCVMQLVQGRSLAQMREIEPIRKWWDKVVAPCSSQVSKPISRLERWKRQRLGHKHLLEQRWIANLLAKIARAVQFAHERAIIHRDLKPGNILIDAQGNPHVTDFGLAKRILMNSSNVPAGAAEKDCEQNVAETVPENITTFDSLESETKNPPVEPQDLTTVAYDNGEGERIEELTRAGHIIGTPGYMAPEQTIDASNITIAVDFYSLGMILYQLLTGTLAQPLPKNEQGYLQLEEYVQQQSKAQLLDPSHKNPAVDPDLSAICRRCLSWKPQDRYRSAAELADELDRFCQIRQVHTRQVGWWEHVNKWRRRQPLLAILTIFLAVISGLVIYKIYTQSVEVQLAQVQTAVKDEQRKSAERQAAARKAANRFNDLPRPGWTALTLEDVKAAIPDNPITSDIKELRDMAVRCFASVDFITQRVIGSKISSLAMAFSPDGEWLAKGENKNFLGFGVELVHLQNKTVRKLNIDISTLDRLDGGSLGIRSIAFSPSGKWLAAGTRSHGIHVWDLTQGDSGHAVKVLTGHKGEINAIVFDPHNKYLITGGLDRQLIVWETETWRVLTKVLLDDPISSLEFSKDKQLLHCSAKWWYMLPSVQLSNLKQRDIPKGVNGGVMAVSGDGYTVFTGNDRTLDRSGKTFEEFTVIGSYKDPREQQAHASSIMQVASHASGTLVASASKDGIVKIWDTGSGHLLSSWRITDSDPYILFHPRDNSLIVTDNKEKETRLYSVIGLDVQRMICPTFFSIARAHFSRDGTSIGVISQDQCYPEQEQLQRQLSRWDDQTGKITASKTIKGEVWNEADLRTSTLHRMEGSLVWRNSGKALLHYWNGQEVVTPSDESTDLQSCIAFSPNGKKLWGSYYGVSPVDAVRNSISKRQGKDLDKKTPGVQVLSWPERKLLGNWLNINSMISGRGSITQIAPGDRWTIIGSIDGRSRILDASTCKQEGKDILCPDGLRVTCVALNKAETMAAIGGWTGKLQVVEVPSGNTICTMEGHLDQITSASWSSDGKYLVTGSRDRTVRLWTHSSKGTWLEVLSQPFPGPITQTEFHPVRLEFIVIVDKEKTIRHWNVTTIRQKLREYSLDWKSTE